MNISSSSLNNDARSLSFGKKTIDLDDLRAVKRYFNTTSISYESDVLSRSKYLIPRFVKEQNGCSYVRNDNFLETVLFTARDFCLMPLDAIDFVISKFPNSKIYNSGIRQAYQEYVQKDAFLRHAQGFYENTTNIVNKSYESKAYPKYHESENFLNIRKKVNKKYNEILNDSLSVDRANYDTKKERFATRLISGLTAALFLGNDYYNKPIKMGKSVEEAKKEQHLKQKQEIRENIYEGIAQFGILGIFSRLANSNIWATAVLGTGVGIVARIISRKRENLPIKRISEDDVRVKQQIPNMNKFLDATKETSKINNKEEDNKKPILSLEHIGMFVVGSIAAGFALKGLKKHTKIGKEVSKLISDKQKEFKNKVKEDIIADNFTLKRMAVALEAGGETTLRKQIEEILSICTGSTNSGVFREINIGEKYKTFKLPFGVEIRQKDTYETLLAVPKFAKELVSYPYKIASKFVSSFSKTPKVEKQDLLDPYKIKNIYLKFTEFENKYGKGSEEASSEFSKYIRKMRIKSNNNITSSKSDNSKIGVISQTLGTLTGIWFNMNDEYNSSIRSGSTKKEAEKDARLRGINKFFRMTVQVVISGALNGIFAKQYNDTIAKTGVIIAASTILTDSASRLLSGMPTKKMTKEELDQYQKAHKQGPMAWYFKMIDKLAS